MTTTMTEHLICVRIQWHGSDQGYHNDMENDNKTALSNPSALQHKLVYKDMNVSKRPVCAQSEIVV